MHRRCVGTRTASHTRSGYTITSRDLKKVGDFEALRVYRKLEDLLRAAYPDFEWDSNRFQEDKATPRRYWNDINNQRSELEKIGDKLGIKQLADWYKICRKDVEAWGGGSLFSYYSSLDEALQAIYPEFPWQASKFGESSRIPRSYLKDLSNQRALLRQIASRLNIKEASDWYKVSRKEFERNGGWRLFKLYPSLYKILCTLYPEAGWDETKFPSSNSSTRPAPGYWQDKDNISRELDKAERKLGLTKPEDWYTITLADLREIGFPNSITKPLLAELLGEKYPLHKWDRIFLHRKRSQQAKLERTLRSLFPDIEMRTNVRKDAQLINPKTGEYLELDVYFPSLHLAFEYQERHHYISSDYSYEPMSVYKTRDSTKRELAKAKGIDLVIVPCWWDNALESLTATIKKVRPEVLPPSIPTGEAIPEDPPEKFFEKQVDNVKGVGQPSLACFFSLSSVNPSNWWMFEKYDGVRGFWNPTEKTFYSRRGTALEFPNEIKEVMPTDIFLDGELWFGRENFQEAIKMATKASVDGVDWSQFKYMVFDIPNHNGTYEERYNALVNYFERHPCKYVEVAKKVLCQDTTHLEEFFQDVVDKGGEGVILRDPSSLYQQGRSAGYLKHKKFRDGEARIVGSAGYQLWECELPNGTRFTAPAATTEFAKRWNPKAGDIVSFKHMGYLLASKKPKSPSLYRLRSDLTWDDVISNWKENKTTRLASASMPLKRKNAVNKVPKGFWRKPENVRKFFTDAAQRFGIDPLKQEGWTTIKLKDILSLPKGNTVLSHFEYSISDALNFAFPEALWNLRKKRVTKGYWQDINNCRKFFEDFAKDKGFDPLQPEGWYQVDLNEMLSKKGAFRLHRKYGGWKKAIQSAFPELQFAKWKPVREAVNKWKDEKTCREYFMSVAQEKDFNPLDEDGWYSFPLSELLKTKEGLYICEQHGGLKKAIQLAFPEIEFTKWQHHK